jgi:hypothetical protein
MTYSHPYKAIEALLLEYFSLRPQIEGSCLTLGAGTEHELTLPIKLLPMIEGVYGDAATGLLAVEEAWKLQLDAAQYLLSAAAATDCKESFDLKRN